MAFVPSPFCLDTDEDVFFPRSRSDKSATNESPARAHEEEATPGGLSNEEGTQRCTKILCNMRLKISQMLQVD